jgi:hypothetical protein
MTDWMRRDLFQRSHRHDLTAPAARQGCRGEDTGLLRKRAIIETI